MLMGLASEKKKLAIQNFKLEMVQISMSTIQNTLSSSAHNQYNFHQYKTYSSQYKVYYVRFSETEFIQTPQLPTRLFQICFKLYYKCQE